ncbi:MAG: cation:dicarboxylase symporter family transporter [Ignavibacteria bacterium]|nr:cation:dicarboxylase symporter family transporter [Ignavibacteria bacterium]
MIKNMLQRLSNVPFAARCLAGLVLGIVAGLAIPAFCAYWQPAGMIFIRASQLVTMPFIMLELACSLGELSNASLRTLIRAGGLIFIFSVLVASAAVLFVPTWLPHLTASMFFNPAMLDSPPPVNLLEKFIPYNIFAAMSDDNFPAVVLFSAFAGLVLQGMSNNQVLLAPMNSARDLFRKLNKIVLKLTPYAVFALVSETVSTTDTLELIRLHALPVIGLGGMVLLSTFTLGITMSFTNLTWKELWTIAKAPLILTLSTSTLIIALPTLVTSLQEVLSEKFKDRNKDMLDACNEQIGAAVPVGFALPTLGQVYMLMMVPFMAWYVDRPFNILQKLQMLATGIPGSIGGIRSVVRQELAEAALPENLLNIFFMNTEWIYRTEKTLSLIGLIVLVLLIVATTTKTMKLNKRRIIGTLITTAGLAFLLSTGVKAMLTRTLAGTYNKDKVLMSRQPLIKVKNPFESVTRIMSLREASLDAFPSLSVSLDSIRKRGFIRVGLKTSDYPWSFHDVHGKLVGYDVDVLQAAANFRSIKIRLIEAPMDVLESMIGNSQIDMAIGGIEDNVYRAARVQTTTGYQLVHRALVTWSDDVYAVQSAEANRLGRPLKIAVADAYLPSPNQKDIIEEHLGSPGPPVPVTFSRIADIKSYFANPHDQKYDALMITAEGGSSWSVLYPTTNVLSVFGPDLPNQMVMLLAGNSNDWHTYMDEWISMQESEGLFKRLYDHWILVNE